VHPSATVDAERVGVGKCRLNNNVYPAVACVTSLYTGVKLPISTSTNVEDVANNARIAVPVSFRAISECMRVHFGRGNQEQVNRGLAPAVNCLGYVKVVKGPYRVKYVPTLIGIIDSGIYLALFSILLDKLGKSGVELTPETVHALVRFMRLMVFYNSLSRYGEVPWLIDRKLSYESHNCSECLSQGNCPDDSCKIDEKQIKDLRGKLLYGAIIAKAIAGVEVRGIEPRQLGIVFKEAYIIADGYVRGLVYPGDSAEFYSALSEILSPISGHPLLKFMVDAHRVLDAMVGRAAVYLTSRLVGNLNKPVTGATVDSEGKQRRLRR
jgi:hypothetical protein